MKKLKIFNIILALIFMVSACDKTYDDIYDELDADREADYATYLEYQDKTESMESYTLTDDDYETISELALEDAVTDDEIEDAEDIGNYKNFSEYILAKDYVPYLLDEEYFSYKAGTEMLVTYNFYRGDNDYIYRFDDENYEEYELVDADYDSMGEDEDEPGEYNNFSSSCYHDDYLPDFLDNKYPGANDWDFKKIEFVYYSGGPYDRYSVYYFLDGEWNKMSNAFVFEAEDYDALGDGYGEPGQYDNFSSSLSPDVYIPIHLKTKFPTADEGDVKQVVYKYFSTSSYTTTSRIKEFVYDGTNWEEYQSTIEQESIFKFTDEGWIFVPPLKFIESTKTPTRFYELVDADYELTGDGTYHNFTISWGGILERISTILKANFNDLAVGDVFEVTYVGYDGGTSEYTMIVEVILDE